MQIVPPLYLLQTLVVFAEQENLVQTAERLGLTQPTVSRQLQQLEELFTQPLFSQQGRNKVLTDYAQALVRELKPRFTDLERVFEKIDHTFSNPQEITLRIAGPRELLEKYLSDIPFAGTLEVEALTESEIQDRFRGQALDLCISAKQIENPELHTKKLASSIPSLAIPKKWAAEIESARDWAQVCGKYPAAAFSKEKPLLSNFEEKYSVQSNCKYVFSDWMSLEKRIHQQKSWSILPSNYLQNDHGYKVIPLTGLFETENFYLAYRKELSKHDWMKALIAEILD